MRPLTVIGAGAGIATLALVGKALASRSAAAPPPPQRPNPSHPPSQKPREFYDGLYMPDAGAPFGPHHGARRPPGLPGVVVVAAGNAGVLRIDGMFSAPTVLTANRVYRERHGIAPTDVAAVRVREASARGAALPVVRRIAAEQQLGDAFVQTMVNLAQYEGEGGTFGVPARTFNVPCRTRDLDRLRRCTTVDAPRSGTLITAWGVFQWNRDAGRDLHTLDDLGLRAPEIPAEWMPWDWTARQEVALPIGYYAQLWALVKKRPGRTDRDAARGVRLWHTGPTRFRRYITDGADPSAWAKVDRVVATRIDRHLARAGVA